jgi:acyl-CoA thioester hydrolase
MKIHETSFRVRYAETDQMGIVYHANYLVWMEIGRVEYCRASGLSYKDLEQNGEVNLAVVEAECRYLKPARYDDLITVQTKVAEAAARAVEFHYEISRTESREILATGRTRHIFLGKDMKPKKLPPNYRPVFGLPIE